MPCLSNVLILRAGARTAVTASRASRKILQRLESFPVIPPRGKKARLHDGPLDQQRREYLGLHPCLGRGVIALGNVPHAHQSLEALERQLHLPAAAIKLQSGGRAHPFPVGRGQHQDILGQFQAQKDPAASRSSALFSKIFAMRAPPPLCLFFGNRGGWGGVVSHEGSAPELRLFPPPSTS